MFSRGSFLGSKPIRNEILDTEARIADLSQSTTVRRLWGIAGSEIGVTIGTDIECYARDTISNRRISNEPSFIARRRQKKLLTAIYRECGDELCAKPFVDSDALEINPYPGRPLEIIYRYLALEERLSSTARSLGWESVIGDGHWHLSVQDKVGGKDIQMINGEEKESYSSFALELAQNLVGLQILCPAFFFRPSRSEKDLKQVLFTKYVDSDRTCVRDSSIQMDHEPYNKEPGSPLHFELRTAHMAPLVPVLMLLHAVEETLMGQKIRASNYDLPVNHLRAGDPFVRGKGCFFDYLRTTQTTCYAASHFPEIFPYLLEAARLSYKTFLETPEWSSMYEPQERVSALRRLGYPEDKRASVTTALSRSATQERPLSSLSLT